MRNKRFVMPEFVKEGESPRPEVQLDPFDYVPDVFKLPFEIDNTNLDYTLSKIIDTYSNVLISQKVLEIAYQRLLHDYLDSSGLVKEKLKIELASSQNEIKLATAMLSTAKEWQEIIQKNIKK